jgi:hypothetical protein
MADPFPFRTADEQDTPVPSRVQARLERMDPDESAPVAAGPLEAADADEWLARATVTESRMERLDQQLRRLRDQLDQVFDDFEDRLAEAETRAGVAEARAGVAEARATFAETRATDAEARANEAHRRVDELLAQIGRLLDPAGPPEAAVDRPDLHGALDQLRDRLDVG